MTAWERRGVSGDWRGRGNKEGREGIITESKGKGGKGKQPRGSQSPRSDTSAARKSSRGESNVIGISENTRSK